MRPSGAVCAVAILVLILTFVPRTGWSQPCIGGTLTAEISTDPGFPNMYRYCLEVSWNLGSHELGHLDIFLQLENCECICDPRFIQFDDPAGSTASPGNDGTCVNDFYGEYVCVGDPSLPQLMLGPAVKFEPVAATCDPGLTGTGLLCFYSPMPPSPATVVPGGLAIKNGQDTCTGDVIGVTPICNCYLQNGRGTWGEIKARYR